jgi:dienelactone hydrolase
MIGLKRRAGAALKIVREVVASEMREMIASETREMVASETRKAVASETRKIKARRRAALTLCAALAITPLVLNSAATAQQVRASSSRDANQYGPFGPEGPRLREQLWIIPSADHGFPLRATVFRPEEAGEGERQHRRPLVVINHGTSDATRMAVAMPVYYWLSRWFVEHGYVVVLPQRRGHGATAGVMAESIGTCTDPDHYSSGLAAADDIEGAVSFMSAQPFVAPGEAIVVGISSGGWASLALASRNPAGVRAVVNIAGGRGGRPFGMRVDAVCGEQRLIEAAESYGRSARIPTLWLYANNDSYFRPDLARHLASAWRNSGGNADLHIFAAYGADGHNLADDRAGWDVWGRTLDTFLKGLNEPPVAALDGSASENAAPPASNSNAIPVAAAADGQTRAP